MALNSSLANTRGLIFVFNTVFFFIEDLTEVCTLVYFHRNLTVVLKIKSMYVAV